MNPGRWAKGIHFVCVWGGWYTNSKCHFRTKRVEHHVVNSSSGNSLRRMVANPLNRTLILHTRRRTQQRSTQNKGAFTEEYTIIQTAGFSILRTRLLLCSAALLFPAWIAHLLLLAARILLLCVLEVQRDIHIRGYIWSVFVEIKKKKKKKKVFLGYPGVLVGRAGKIRGKQVGICPPFFFIKRVLLEIFFWIFGWPILFSLVRPLNFH